jgi:cell fate regulator YaaT (PSP1 superfamily)
MEGKTVYKIRFPVTNNIGELLVDDIRYVQYLKKGAQLLAESERGLELVEFLGPSEEHCPSNPVAVFIRRATYYDVKKYQRYRNIAQKIFKELSQYAVEYGLNLRPLDCYIPLDNQKIYFFYTAPKRVDFRQFIRDMSRRYRKRIEMRQVGVRDAVQMKGGIGVCGNLVCCYNFIEKFESVPLDYINEQNLPYSPSKFTGICGRLKCCLAIEKNNYIEKKLLPPINSEIGLLENKETAQVLEIDPLRKLIVLKIGETTKEFPISYITPQNFEKIVKAYDCVGCQCPPSPLFGQVKEETDETALLSDIFSTKRFF